MAGRRKSRRSAGSLQFWRIDWSRLRRPAHAAGWLIGVGGLAAAWSWGVPRLGAYAVQAHRAGDVEVHLADVPAWMSGDLAAHLTWTAQQHLTADPLARHELVEARAALLETGWFADVRRVRRIGERSVEVEATFVAPYAVIRDRRGDHLIDPQARLLPRTFDHGQAPGLVAITGARFDRPDDTGVPWAGGDVTAALRVLRLLQDRPWRDQVSAIDVSRYLSDRTIVLVTDRGSRIVWGRAPGEEAGVEVPASRKLTYLDYHHEQYGHIDRGYTGTLNITTDVVTVTE